MRRSRHRFGFDCLLAAAALWPVLQARPADARIGSGDPAERRVAPRLLLVGSADFCATYGAGFVRLQGTDTCVRIGGHVRVGTTMDGSEQFEWGAGSFVAVPGETESAPSHVRLDGDFNRPGFR